MYLLTQGLGDASIVDPACERDVVELLPNPKKDVTKS